MPTYEYQCKACGQPMEAFQKISDAPLINCPNCHKDALQQLVSAAQFQLKGSGWYVTDYSAKGKKSETTTTEKPADKLADASSSTSEPSSTLPPKDSSKDKASGS